MSAELTALDQAHTAMEASPEDDAIRLQFYERLADAELFMPLTEEPKDDDISPMLFPVEGTEFVLLFDREDRLTAFAEGPSAYAALSGRSAVALLAGQDLGIALNPGVAPSAMLLPPEAVAWLAQTLDHAPEELEEKPEEVMPPAGLPEVLIKALDTKLAMAEGLARMAYLVKVRYDGGREGHLLAFVEAVPGSEDALAQAAKEALTFSGIEAGVMDVAFFRASHPMSAALARHGLRFDLPEAPKVQVAGAEAPGMDPDRPPRLR